MGEGASRSRGTQPAGLTAGGWGIGVGGWCLHYQPLSPIPDPLVLGGDSRVGSALACWSSLHCPRLAGRPARRVLFPVDVINSSFVSGILARRSESVNQALVVFANNANAVDSILVALVTCSMR